MYGLCRVCLSDQAEDHVFKLQRSLVTCCTANQLRISLQAYTYPLIHHLKCICNAGLKAIRISVLIRSALDCRAMPLGFLATHLKPISESRIAILLLNIVNDNKNNNHNAVVRKMKLNVQVDRPLFWARPTSARSQRGGLRQLNLSASRRFRLSIASCFLHAVVVLLASAATPGEPSTLPPERACVFIVN